MIVEVYPPGTAVEIGDGAVQGRITAISIVGDFHVRYQVVYYVSADRKEPWVESFEVSGKTEKVKIGFIHG